MFYAVLIDEMVVGNEESIYSKEFPTHKDIVRK